MPKPPPSLHLMPGAPIKRRDALRLATCAVEENKSFRVNPHDRGEQFPQERRYLFRFLFSQDDQPWAKKRLGQIRGEID